METMMTEQVEKTEAQIADEKLHTDQKRALLHPPHKFSIGEFVTVDHEDLRGQVVSVNKDSGKVVAVEKDGDTFRYRIAIQIVVEVTEANLTTVE